MADLSLSSVLNRRKRFKIATMFTLLLLVIFAASFLILKNPKKSKASAVSCNLGSPADCTFDISTSTYTIYVDSNFDVIGGVTKWEDGGANGGAVQSMVTIPQSANVILDGSTVPSHKITVTTKNYGSASPITFKSLTLRNNAKLTQEAVGINAYSNQKVNLAITGDLTLKSGSSIDVTGQGYSGGTSNHVIGYGNSGGMNCTIATPNRCGAGGGAHGGAGGMGYDLTSANVAGGSAYDSSANPLLPGSGGGVANPNTFYVPGGNGGGVIQLTILGNLYFDNSSHILADGTTGALNAGQSGASGSGAGGSINIRVTNNIYTTLDGSLPNFSGGTSSTGIPTPQVTWGIDGSHVWSFVSLNKNISAAGGTNAIGDARIPQNNNPIGGGGGGGRILLQTGISTPSQWCYISGGLNGTNVGSIPAACENQDVTIDGAVGDVSGVPLIIDAGAVKIDPTNANYLANPALAVCSDPNSSNCDSRRHFTSLTIMNNAVVTHTALDPNNMPASGNPSIADNTTGTERWKKVDLVTTTDVTLKTGGEINVSGKGYPGSYYTGWNDNTYIGIPRGFVWNNAWIDGEGVTETYGWGPGGGVTNPFWNYTSGGGGGFGGAGRPGFHDMNCGDASCVVNSLYYLNGTRTINTAQFGTGSNSYSYKTSAGNFEWGSGGGGAGHTGFNDVTVIDGGYGGGKVIIQAQNIIFSDSNSNSLFPNPREVSKAKDTYTGIFADGATGQTDHLENDAVWSGGGAGGLIYLQGTISYSGVYSAIVSGGDTHDQGYAQVGKIVDSNGSPVSPAVYPLSAIGGENGYDSYLAHAYGHIGSGGGGGWIVLGLPKITVNKTLYPVSRVATATTNLACPAAALRNGTGYDSTNPNCFDPYALQVGDVIEVYLDIAGATGTYTLNDGWLSGLHKCNPSDPSVINSNSTGTTSGGNGSFNPLGVAWGADPLVLSGDLTVSDIYYQCKVQ